MSDTNIAAAAALFAGAGLLWSIIWSVISANKLNQIQKDVTLSNRLHDQSVQRLYRAREAAIAWNKAHVYLSEYTIAKQRIKQEPDEGYFVKMGELSAAKAELKGVATAINDPQLLKVADIYINFDWDKPDQNESEMRLKAQQLHTRITELLQEATKL